MAWRSGIQGSETFTNSMSLVWNTFFTPGEGTVQLTLLFSLYLSAISDTFCVCLLKIYIDMLQIFKIPSVLT